MSVPLPPIFGGVRNRKSPTHFAAGGKVGTCPPHRFLKKRVGDFFSERRWGQFSGCFCIHKRSLFQSLLTLRARVTIYSHTNLPEPAHTLLQSLKGRKMGKRPFLLTYQKSCPTSKTMSGRRACPFILPDPHIKHCTVCIAS